MVTANTSNSVPVGLMRLARIVRYDPKRGTATIRMANVAESFSSAPDITISIPASYSSNDGVFAGGFVGPNTPVAVALGEGGRYYFVSWVVGNPGSLPDVQSGSYLISTNKS